MSIGLLGSYDSSHNIPPYWDYYCHGLCLGRLTLFVGHQWSEFSDQMAISTPDIGVLGNGIPSTICTMLADAIIVSVTYFIIAYL